MPSFSTQVSNPLGKEQATERLKDFVEQLTERYKDQVSEVDGAWDENKLNFSFTTYGFQIKGEVEVEDEDVRLKGKLPLAAMAFRKKIEHSIADELTKLLT